MELPSSFSLLKFNIIELHFNLLQIQFQLENVQTIDQAIRHKQQI